MITLGVHVAVPDQTALIIRYDTGVKYKAQCGGLACAHPTLEGFVIGLGEFMSDFDDCNYGCCHIPELPVRRLELAKALDERLKEYTKKWRYQISFDFDRIEETMEGWWPVIVEGTIDDWGSLRGKFWGILHTGNCD